MKYSKLIFYLNVSSQHRCTAEKKGVKKKGILNTKLVVRMKIKYEKIINVARFKAKTLNALNKNNNNFLHTISKKNCYTTLNKEYHVKNCC